MKVDSGSLTFYTILGLFHATQYDKKGAHYFTGKVHSQNNLFTLGSFDVNACSFDECDVGITAISHYSSLANVAQSHVSALL